MHDMQNPAIVYNDLSCSATFRSVTTKR